MVPKEIPSLQMPKPHGRLLTAVVLLSLLVAVQSVTEISGWASGVLQAGVVLFTCWVAFVGVYRVPTLHYVWGWVCLIGSLVVAILIIGSVIENGQLPSALPTLRVFVGLIALPTIGYLLVIDRRVRQYRRFLSSSHEAPTPAPIRQHFD
jgi:hypothetical protein